MLQNNQVGLVYLQTKVNEIVDTIERLSPTQFNEENRYLPSSVTSIPGFLSYNVNPYMREIIDCFDVDSPVREMNLMKGVQITYSTMLESIMLYYMVHVKSLPIMYITADKELATARVENNIIPMLNQSGFGHIIRSSDEGNSRKTGKTAHHLQFEGGGYMVPFGARNADKMRMYSIAIMLKDEIDAWMETVGKDGDPDLLTDHRCRGYWERRKIARGSTPLLEGSSKIHFQYMRGDQRKYNILCMGCGFPQFLRWITTNKKTGIVGGLHWETERNQLLLESVSYVCSECGHKHYDYDKRKLFSPDHGAYWKPTARPAEPNIRSYHLPAMYSPIGMAPWYTCVTEYLKGYNPLTKRVINIGKYQGFYNNILAQPFRMPGSKIKFEAVSAHRRIQYSTGEIPNKFATQYCGSKILLLTCTVDVHKENLAVAVIGWTVDRRCFIISYERFYDNDCTETHSKVWGKLQKIIEETVYTADTGEKYGIAITLIDAGYKQAVVTSFCGQYTSGVYPSLGRQTPTKNQLVKEFGEFTSQSGVIGFNITVDHYKDRLGPVMRRSWDETQGLQDSYHFNAPVDITDAQLRELTVETRRKKINPNGSFTYVYYRPSGVDNELWDLLVYASAAVEILAYNMCIKHFELETVDWPKFWKFIESEKLYFTT